MLLLPTMARNSPHNALSDALQLTLTALLWTELREIDAPTTPKNRSLGIFDPGGLQQNGRLHRIAEQPNIAFPSLKIVQIASGRKYLRSTKIRSANFGPRFSPHSATKTNSILGALLLIRMRSVCSTSYFVDITVIGEFRSRPTPSTATDFEAT